MLQEMWTNLETRRMSERKIVELVQLKVLSLKLSLLAVAVSSSLWNF